MLLKTRLFCLQDFQHNLHHILTIFNQLIFIYYSKSDDSNMCIDEDFLHTLTIQYYMLITNIFSALRKISKNNNWTYARQIENL